MPPLLSHIFPRLMVWVAESLNAADLNGGSADTVYHRTIFLSATLTASSGFAGGGGGETRHRGSNSVSFLQHVMSPHAPKLLTELTQWLVGLMSIIEVLLYLIVPHCSCGSK